MLAGRFTEVSADPTGAPLTLVFRLVLEAQRHKELVAWIGRKDSCFYPPDAAETGVDLAALPVILATDPLGSARAADLLLRSGVIPTFEGRPRLVRPPLLHWIQVALFRVAGPTELASRLPSTVASLGSLAILGWVARRRFGREGALWAAAILGTMPLFVAVGRLGTLDALLSVHILAAVALDIAEPDEVGRFRALAIGGLLGLAFLAKGPVGVALPLLIMLAGRTACGREILPAGRSVAQGVAGWCVVVLPWGLTFVGRVGPAETLDVLRSEALGRFFSGPAHGEPAWFVPAVVVAGTFPWVGPFAVGLARAGKCGRCNIGHTYVCLDRPVFTYAQLRQLPAEF